MSHTEKCFRSDGDWFCAPQCMHDVEELRPVAQPVLGDQQVARARDRQELGDAFDDAEQ